MIQQVTEERVTQAISESACEAVFAAVQLARGAGASFVFDANFRPALWDSDSAGKIIRRTVPLCDIFLLSLDDAQLLTGSDEPEQVLDWCVAAGASTIVLKLGSEGVIYTRDGTTRRVNGFSVDAVDATGAGDCFAGALMARLGMNDGFDAAIVYACAAAALTCTGFGAIDPVPPSTEVFQLMERQGNRKPTPVRR